MSLTTKDAETLAEAIHRAASWWPTPLGGEEARDIAQALIASGAVRREAEVRAEALREAAADVPLFEFMLVMDIAAEVAPAQIGAWLRDRAALAEEGDRSVDWTRLHRGTCPSCGEDKFIGHGPLCWECYMSGAGE